MESVPVTGRWCPVGRAIRWLDVGFALRNTSTTICTALQVVTALIQLIHALLS